MALIRGSIVLHRLIKGNVKNLQVSDSGPLWPSCLFFRGSGPVLLRDPIFCDFSGVIRTPCLPSGSPNESACMFKSREQAQFDHCFSAFRYCYWSPNT